MAITLEAARRELRTVFLHGAAGQLVSGGIWGVSASFASWGGTREAILVLVVGGAFIYPLTQLLLRLLGRPAAPHRENPLNALAMQVAFTVPLLLPLAGAAALHDLRWFYPACMLIVGVHYLPFIFLYGIWQFGVLAAVLVGAAFALVFLEIGGFAAGAWITTGALLAFAAVMLTRRREAPPAPGDADREADGMRAGPHLPPTPHRVG